ncbi:Polysaccharide biosynthesis protein [Nocardioides dokdonensis FR1436]|uniref:Polysaccharide biosynthesis protein n=1 Tax=Nocardioides dokdonensis FR1436 TaxID=1300347 RepID=A0A1A9GPB5_9ACTN|nr:polysaccharide biosynthesis C-terminal domain-containing protein [Nocardioides dokdonensis]ANH40149.1 Polysaccharide biosynthesis protein [Nocardioides dokdonensis FR1436]
MAEQLISATTHRAARNAVVRAVAEVLGKVATLAWTVAAARMLSNQDFGTISYAMTIMLVLSSLAAWGFDSGLTRRGSAEPDALPGLHRATQVWKTALAAPVFLVAGVLLAGSPAIGSWPVLAFMLLAGFTELWSHTVRSTAAARQVSAGISAALVLQRIATAAAVLVALALGAGAEGVAFGFLLGSAAGWGAHVLALRRLDVRRSALDLRRADLADAVHGTFLIGLSGLVLMLLFRVDVLILGVLEGPGEVAVYSVAYRLLETVLFVTYAINYAVLPVLSATDSSTTRRLGYERAVAVAAFVYLPFVVVSLVEGRAVIDLLFGASYAAAAAPVLAWLAPAPMFLAMASFATSVLLALQRTRVMLLASSAALLINLVLNLVLIPQFGAVGAAAATTFAYLVQVLVVLTGLSRLGERPALLTPLTSAGVAAVVLLAALVLSPLPLLVELALGGVVYLAVWLVLVRRLAPEQLQVVMGLVQRRRQQAS